jgi:hypothetical protein
MMYRVLLLSALLFGVTAPGMAATLAIAWDPSSEANLAGYRVFVGTSPGRPTNAIDVGPFQTSFYYTGAVAGQRYYFAVATLVPGLAGDKSQEVSAVAQEPEAASVPVPASSAAVAVHTRLLRDSDAARAHGSPEAFGSAVTEVASGLGDITAMAVIPGGGGLLVERGASLRSFSDQGVGAPGYETPAGTRIAALAIDPNFENTGFIYVAEARPARGGDEISVVRHRLLAGLLGESATVVSAGVQAKGTAVALAISTGGDVILAQGASASRFRQDGVIARRWPSTLAATGTGVTPALAWDNRRQGFWRAGIDASPDLTVSFVPLGGDGSGQVTAVQALEEGVVAIGMGMLGATPTVALASDTTVFRLDVAASRLSSETSLAGYGTVVALVVAEPATDFVVVREPSADTAGHASYSLLRVRYRSVP